MTKAELLEIASKYQMQPCVNNTVENIQEGFYLDSPVCIQELDDLADHYHEHGPDPAYVEAMYDDGGRLGCLYKIFAPRNWF